MTDQPNSLSSDAATTGDPLAELDEFSIELPSWAFGNAGTRFKVFSSPGVPRDPFEKVSDAAQVHRFTGLAPRVSLHIPWDLVPDERGGFDALAAHAREEGVSIGAVNSNLFQDDDYRLGSLAHPRSACATRRSPTTRSASTSCAPPGRATSSCGCPTAPTTRGRTRCARARTGSPTRCSRSTGCSTRGCGCWSSTSCSSRRSTRWTSRTGARR